jgi:ribonuclease P protein component
MLRKNLRLRRPGQFRSACSSGDRYVDAAFVLYVRGVSHGGTKVGFAAGKRLGGAVTRNLLKRRCREAFRPLVDYLEDNVHVVVVVRGAARALKPGQIRERLCPLLRQAGVLKEGGSD